MSGISIISIYIAIKKYIFFTWTYVLFILLKDYIIMRRLWHNHLCAFTLSLFADSFSFVSLRFSLSVHVLMNPTLECPSQGSISMTTCPCTFFLYIKLSLDPFSPSSPHLLYISLYLSSDFALSLKLFYSSFFI